MESNRLPHPAKSQATPLGHLLGYALGGCAYQLPFNALWAFAMVYYTQILGLDSILAGLALSITTFWDALADPFIGHLSDNTRSRYGKRHPYMLVGGVILALSSYFLWSAPGFCAGKWILFAYVLLINFIFRTAMAVFAIPYGALGFEICTDYDERSKLQSIASVVGMLVNFFGIAMGWRLFFPNRGESDGSQFASNYAHMGLTFSIVSLVLVLFCLWTTRRYIRDGRGDEKIMGNSLRAFYLDIRDIFMDRRAIIVFLFFGTLSLGNALVACWQTFTWIYYMEFDGGQKTICHAAGMIGFILGAFLSTLISKKLDKKPSVCIGAGLSILGSLALLLIFYTGLLGNSVSINLPYIPWLGVISISISLIVFAFFQAVFWMGTGVMSPIATSMVADISEINRHDTGILKDGSYSAVFCFLIKLAGGIGLLVQGVCLKLIGFKEGSNQQPPEAIDRLVLFTFTSGAFFALVALLIAMKYRVNRRFMATIKESLAARET